MAYQLPLILTPPGYITADEALARRMINQEQYERWIYGGLSKKEHDRMIALAMKANDEFHKSLDDDNEPSQD